MTSKNEYLEKTKRLYAKYLKGRKKPNNEESLEAGFDFGYEAGLWTAWQIFYENRDEVIKNEEKNGGIFRKYNASFAIHKLMNLVSDKHREEEAYHKYKPIECFCEKCGKLK